MFWRLESVIFRWYIPSLTQSIKLAPFDIVQNWQKILMIGLNSGKVQDRIINLITKLACLLMIYC